MFAAPPRSQLYFHANDHFESYGLDGTPIFTVVDGLPQDDHQPVVSPDGSVYTNLFDARGPGLMLGKFDGNGNSIWHVFDKFVTSTNTLSTPDVGSDSVVYDGRNLASLYSFNPGSSIRWQYVDSGILFAPIVSPNNDLIFVGGVVTFGQPGFFEAISTSGVALWKLVLPVENGLNIVPKSRARFTPDGQTAYIGTSIPGQGADGYSYLYSVQTGSGAPVGTPATLSTFTLTPATLVGGNTSRGTVTLTAPAPSGGAASSLTSGNSAVAAVPASVTVSAGATTSSFSVNTGSVTAITARPTQRFLLQRDRIGYPDRTAVGDNTTSASATGFVIAKLASQLGQGSSNFARHGHAQRRSARGWSADQTGQQQCQCGYASSQRHSPGRSQVSNLHSTVEQSKNNYERDDFRFTGNGCKQGDADRETLGQSV